MAGKTKVVREVKGTSLGGKVTSAVAGTVVGKHAGVGGRRYRHIFLCLVIYSLFSSVND